MDIKQVTETIAMIEEQNFDVRTITMGFSLLDCIDPDIEKAAEKVYNKIVTKAALSISGSIQSRSEIPIVMVRTSKFCSSIMAMVSVTCLMSINSQPLSYKLCMASKIAAL